MPAGEDPYRLLVELMLRAPVRVTSTARDAAYERHVEDALSAADLVAAEASGPLVDVGSGGGIPGLVLALRFPERAVTLLEATARKAAFLVATAAALGLENVDVVPERSEHYAGGAGRDAYAVATARALAPPAVACELCLPLVRPGGALVLYAGLVEPATLGAAAEALAAEVERIVAVGGSERRRLILVRKTGHTPARFPRRPGVAAKRPLAGTRFT